MDRVGREDLLEDRANLASQDNQDPLGMLASLDHRDLPGSPVLLVSLEAKARRDSLEGSVGPDRRATWERQAPWARLVRKALPVVVVSISVTELEHCCLAQCIECIRDIITLCYVN